MTPEMQFLSNSGHSITLTAQEWAGLQRVAANLNLSVSELLGLLGRGQLIVTNSLELKKPLDGVVVIEGLGEVKQQRTDSSSEPAWEVNAMSYSNPIKLEQMRVKIFDTKAPGNSIGSSYRFLLGLVEKSPNYVANEMLLTVAAANTEAELIELQQRWNDFLENLEKMELQS